MILGAFFEHKGNYDLIIEQTFFCALPPTMRQKYVWKMHQLLRDSGKIVGLLFNKIFESGPPFGGSKAEYVSLFKDAFYYDEFNKGFYTTYRKTEPVLIDKNFEISFKMYLQREYLFCKATTSAVKDALSVFLTTVPTRNPMKEHFEKSSWDGTGRIDSFFQDIYGADNSEYIKDCGRIFWLSLIFCS